MDAVTVYEFHCPYYNHQTVSFEDCDECKRQCSCDSYVDMMTELKNNIREG